MFILLYIALLPIVYCSTEEWKRDILLYLHACGLMLWWHCPSLPGDLYGLRHMWLNLEIPPKTFWCNMGYWSEGVTEYYKACQRLVQAVTDKLDIKPNNTVLDIGYGCGDSCFFLADYCGCQVTGITNERAQWQLSQDRVKQLPQQQQDRIKLVEGSATALDEALLPAKDEKASMIQFDHIVSIDSAYHYNTRWQFLEQALHYLKPGGTLGLYDIVLDDQVNLESNWKSCLWKLICHIGQLPWDNLEKEAGYRSRLEQLGYIDIRFEQLPTEQTFGGLSNHCSQQMKKMNVLQLGHWQDILYLMVCSFVFGQLTSHQWLQPMIITATKKHTSC